MNYNSDKQAFFFAYKNMMAELHELTLENKDHSDEAKEIRVKMAKIYPFLTEKQIQQLKIT